MLFNTIHSIFTLIGVMVFKEQIKQMLVDDVLNRFETVFDDADSNDNFQNLYEIFNHDKTYYNLFKHLGYNQGFYDLLDLFSKLQYDILDDGELNLIWVEMSTDVCVRVIHQKDYFIVDKDCGYINKEYLQNLLKNSGFGNSNIDDFFVCLFGYEDLEWFAKVFVPEYKQFEKDYSADVQEPDFEKRIERIHNRFVNEKILKNKIKERIINHKYFRKINV